MAGFRGFNEERTIPFHDQLTLIYAPNSYGKTSISEAFEFLLYGVTSKVQAASSKEEYKGSYRNRHFPHKEKPQIKLDAEHGGVDLLLICEFDDDIPIRFVETDGSRARVENWPIQQQAIATRPFILQHALKDLLLAKPDQRFHGLARLLGLDALDEVHSSIVALCTKPEESIPGEVSKVLSQSQALEARVNSFPGLADLQQEFANKNRTPESIIRAAHTRAALFVPASTTEEGILGALLKKREEEIGKVFSQHVALSILSAAEVAAETEGTRQILASLSEGFVGRYTSLARLATLQHIENRARFLDLGKDLLRSSPGQCPFCGKPLDNLAEGHIDQQHARLATDRATFNTLDRQRRELREELAHISTLLEQSLGRHISKSRPFLANKASLEQIRQILTPSHKAHYDALETALLEVSKAARQLEEAYKHVQGAVSLVESTLETSIEDQALIRAVVDGVVSYAEAARAHRTSLAGHTDAASHAA